MLLSVCSHHDCICRCAGCMQLSVYTVEDGIDASAPLVVAIVKLQARNAAPVTLSMTCQLQCNDARPRVQGCTLHLLKAIKNVASQQLLSESRSEQPPWGRSFGTPGKNPGSAHR